MRGASPRDLCREYLSVLDLFFTGELIADSREINLDHYSFFSPRAVSRPEASLDTSRAQAPRGDGSALSVFSVF